MKRDFNEDLKFEKKNNYILNDLYKRLWPSVTSINHNLEVETQKLGIDKFLNAPEFQLKIEEKIRRDWYGDILLEYTSVDVDDVPGWMEKRLLCDYIFYAVLPTNTAFWFYYPQLKELWDLNRDNWIRFGESEMYGFTRIVSENNGYNTISVGVKPEILLNNIPTSGFNKIT